MKKSGGKQTSTYIMYGLIILALILLTLFIVQGTMTERFFATTTTSDPIQANFNKITAELANLNTALTNPNTLCKETFTKLLRDTKNAIEQYILERKQQHDIYATTFNNLALQIRTACNRSDVISVQDIPPQIPPPSPSPGPSGAGTTRP